MKKFHIHLFTKHLISLLVFLFCFIVFTTDLKANSAVVSGSSYSLMLADASALVEGELFRFLFTTYDGDRYSLPYYYGSGYISYSREFKKIGSLYKADYYNTVSGYIYDFGEASFNLYSSDSNNNGLDDVCEKIMSTSNAITGTWYSADGTSGAITGNFNKIAGYQQGSYNLTVYSEITVAGKQNLSGVYYVGELSGTISYNPSTYSMTFDIKSTWDVDYPLALDPTTYEIIDSDNIKVLSEGFVPTTIFTRTGNKYSALVTLPDGEDSTFWPDYQKWLVSVQDFNDSDGDGIPDLSDICLNNPEKSGPGICGCSVADTDTDNDGIADCNDSDDDDDGISDTDDNFPTVPILLSDLNNSGSVELQDVILALQVMTSTVSPISLFKEAEVNGDGQIGLEEAINALHVISEVRTQP